MKNLILFTLLAFLLTPVIASAQDSQNTTEPFRQLKQVTDTQIIVPTVLELEISDTNITSNEFAVQEIESGEFQPYYIKTYSNTTTPQKITSSPQQTSTNIHDDNLKTYTEYELQESDKGSITITSTATKPITSSSLSIQLDKNVALPTHITILVDNKTVLARTRMLSRTVDFPKTTSDNWQITLDYTQPLRITEFQIIEEKTTTGKTIRFLAQPDKTYNVYFNPDVSTHITTGESADLTKNQDVKTLHAIKTQDNQQYKKADSDNDTIPNEIDNCVLIQNTDQTDINNNNKGDVCEDYDKDGIINQQDNCQNTPNAAQRDEDGDNIGDACDNEESRITEKNKWLPWLAMATVTLIIAGLVAKTLLINDKK